MKLGKEKAVRLKESAVCRDPESLDSQCPGGSSPHLPGQSRKTEK